MIYMCHPSFYRSHHACTKCLFTCCLLVLIDHSDPNERAHFWLPNSELTKSHELLDSPTADRMYFETGEVIRVRVESDEFYDNEPGPPKALEGVTVMKEAARAPYTVVVSFFIV